MIEATIGDGLNGDIAIDDVSFTPGCIVYTGTDKFISIILYKLIVIHRYKTNTI